MIDQGVPTRRDPDDGSIRLVCPTCGGDRCRVGIAGFVDEMPPRYRHAGVDLVVDGACGHSWLLAFVNLDSRVETRNVAIDRETREPINPRYRD